MLLSPRSWLLKGEGRLLGWANPSPLQGFLAFGHGCSKLVSFCIGLTSGSNKSPLGAPMLVQAAQGGPKAQGSQDMAPPSGDSRFSSSVAATSTSSGSIWQASARAWPVAMTKLASAAKESSPPRTRACKGKRMLSGSSRQTAFWDPHLGTTPTIDPTLSP